MAAYGVNVASAFLLILATSDVTAYYVNVYRAPQDQFFDVQVPADTVPSGLSGSPIADPASQFTGAGLGSNTGALSLGPSQDQQAPVPMGSGPGGPWDLSYLNDPAQQSMMQQRFPASGQMPSTVLTTGVGSASGIVQFTSPSGAIISVQQPFAPVAIPQSFDYYGNSYPLQYSIFPPSQLNSHATGNVINSGSALQGALSASGRSNTRTDAQGAGSMGTGQIGGSGTGIQGTSVNTAGSNSGMVPSDLSSWFPNGSPFGPSSGAANAMFVNSLTAGKGTVSGTSDTMTQTGLNGNSFGSSGGTANGRGQGLQLTQVASSDSQGLGYSGSPYGPTRF